MKILGISGSIRARSTNSALLLATKRLAPSGSEVIIFEGITELPHFNPDLDFEGATLPPSVSRLREALAKTDALIISTPEYAHGIPGVLKNALDWLVSGPEMVGRPVGLIYGSATEANFAKAALIEVLTTMSAKVIPSAVVSIPGVRTKMNEAGELSDPSATEALRDGLRNLLAGS